MTDLERTLKAIEEIENFKWASHFNDWQGLHGIDFISLNVQLTKAQDLLKAYAKSLE